MKRRAALRSEEGAVAVAGLLLTFALALLLGAAVDIGHAFVLRAQLTAVADDAALAGAGELDLAAWRQGRLALDVAAARTAADDELSVDGAAGSVEVIEPVRVQVTVARSFATYALRLVGIPRLVVRASAAASPETP